MSEFYTFTALDHTGAPYDFSTLEGKVVLVVNTATGCGFTPQYTDLEEMYEAFRDRGFEILDFPSNQFAGQTPGTDAEVRAYVQEHYHTQFPQLQKCDVNGENALPLFRWLEGQKGFESFGKGPKAIAMSALLKGMDKDYKSKPDIKWNFTKFLVDRQGNVAARFEPTHSMKEVRSAVEKLL